MTRRLAEERRCGNEEGPQPGAAVPHSARENKMRAGTLGYLAVTRARSAT